MRLDEDRHVEEELVQFRYRGLQPCDVFVPLLRHPGQSRRVRFREEGAACAIHVTPAPADLDIGERIACCGVAGSLQDLLSEDLGLLVATVKGSIYLVAGCVRLHNLVFCRSERGRK